MLQYDSSLAGVQKQQTATGGEFCQTNRTVTLTGRLNLSLSLNSVYFLSHFMPPFAPSFYLHLSPPFPFFASV